MSERTPDVPEVGDEVLVLGTAGPYTVVARNPSGPHIDEAAVRQMITGSSTYEDAATADPEESVIIHPDAANVMRIASLEHAVIESALALHHVAGAPADTVYQASRTLYRNTIALAEALKENTP